jgi:hypothetical protein
MKKRLRRALIIIMLIPNLLTLVLLFYHIHLSDKQHLSVHVEMNSMKTEIQEGIDLVSEPVNETYLYFMLNQEHYDGIIRKVDKLHKKMCYGRPYN